MKLRWTVTASWVLLVAAVVGLVALAPGPGLAQAQPEVPPGVVYTCERDGAGPWAVYVAKVARSEEYGLAAALAQDTVFGLETVPEQARRVKGAVAAINGDWFELPAGPYQGDTRGLLVREGELVSEATGADCFWVDRQGELRLGPVTTKLEVIWEDGSRLEVGLNRDRAGGPIGPGADPRGEAVLYTPVLGASTRTTGGRELVLEKVGEEEWLPLRIGQTLTARVRAVSETGDTALVPGQMVLSLGPGVAAGAPQVERGALLRVAVASEPDLSGVELALGGGQALVREGEVETFTGELPRHPRTAFGWNATHYFLIVVDGRRPGWSVGMTVAELAELARRVGCTEALNMDGGGSSTLWLRDAVVNLPSDGQPRAVGNALVVVREAER